MTSSPAQDSQLSFLIDLAVGRLTSTSVPVESAAPHVPPVAGLYAIHATSAVWEEVGISHPGAVPLYVGKAESSLVARDLMDHFALDPSRPARTGQSTLRRSFAALLRQRLDLRAVPRNPARPGHFSNFGLTVDGESRLSAWMRSRLSIAVWTMPSETQVPLRSVEKGVLWELAPPLNLTGVPVVDRELKQKRALMAAEARSWRAP